MTAAHLEAHHEALHLLHMQREVPCLDDQLAIAAEAQHVLKVAVPSHAVGALRLKQQLLMHAAHSIGTAALGCCITPPGHLTGNQAASQDLRTLNSSAG